MMETIGNVQLETRYAAGRDQSAAATPFETRLQELVSAHPEKDFPRLLTENPSWPLMLELSPLRQSLLNWIPFQPGEKVLEIGSGCGALTGAFLGKGLEVTCVDPSLARSRINATRHAGSAELRILIGEPEEVLAHLQERFDHVILIGGPESDLSLPESASSLQESVPSLSPKDQPLHRLLRRIRTLLKDSGSLWIAADNPLGLKYFAGCPEPRTNRYFEGIEGFPSAVLPVAAELTTRSAEGVEGLSEKHANAFSRRQILSLAESGGYSCEFYYPYPDYRFPVKIFSDAFLPRKGELNRNWQFFGPERLELFDESRAFDAVLEAGLFPELSNAFLVRLRPAPALDAPRPAPEQGLSAEASGSASAPIPAPEQVLYAKASVERRPAFRQQTLILRQGETLKARKIPIGPDALPHMKTYVENRRLMLEAASAAANKDNSAAANKAASPNAAPPEPEPLLIQLIPCTRNPDGSVDFPYCAQPTLSDRLRGLAPQAYLRHLSAFREALIRTYGSVPFAWTPAFDDLFGGVAFPEKPESLSVTNVDMNFDNVFCLPDGKYMLIDYEWVFTFPVPLAFVLYRSLVLDPTYTSWPLETRQKLLSALGISPSMADRFHRMELGLLRHISPEEDKLDYFIRTPGARETVLYPLKDLLSLPEENRRLKQELQSVESRLWFRALRRVDRKVLTPARRGLRRFARQDNLIGTACGSLVLLLRKGPAAAFYHGIRPEIAKSRVRAYLKQLEREQRVSAKAASASPAAPAVSAAPGNAASQAAPAQAASPVKFSIVVPLFNTPEPFLLEMIASVRAQTYPNWELCLADGSHAAHAAVGETCRRLAAQDPRIRYQKLSRNGGISENTNAAIAMATGDYIVLFDHDDLLHASALEENARAIASQGADFLYSDEMVFESPNRKKILATHFKPDYSPESLLTNNYICHLSVFKASLLAEVGGFRRAYDGSQDFDLILRLTDRAKKVVHLPKVLYFWRSHPSSVAADVAQKPYAVEAGRRAIRDFLRERKGIEAVVESTEAFPTLYHVRYPVPAAPAVTLFLDLTGFSPARTEERARAWLSWAREQRRWGARVMPVVIGGEGCEHETRSLPGVAWMKPDSESRARRLCEAVEKTDGDFLLFLDPALDPLSPEPLQELLMLAAQPRIGAVGGKILFPDGSVRCAGLVLGCGSRGLVGRGHFRYLPSSSGYFGGLAVVGNVSAVSVECLLLSRAQYAAAGGFCPDYADTLFDVDLCLRLREKGFRNLFSPFASFRGESPKRLSLNYGSESPRYDKDAALFAARWKQVLSRPDPYYNPNLTTRYSDHAPR